MEKLERRVLVVDDDDAIRALLFTVLRRRGVEVDVARNGVEALERCRECRYALVLLDLMMPRKSGQEVLQELASFDECDRPVVIVLTAGNDPRDLDPAIVAGTIRKPFDLQLLVSTVKGLLDMSASAAQKSECPAADSERRDAN